MQKASEAASEVEADQEQNSKMRSTSSRTARWKHRTTPICTTTGTNGMGKEICRGVNAGSVRDSTTTSNVTTSINTTKVNREQDHGRSNINT